MKALSICPTCGGIGTKEGKTCPACGGKGVVQVKSIPVTIFHPVWGPVQK